MSARDPLFHEKISQVMKAIKRLISVSLILIFFTLPHFAHSGDNTLKKEIERQRQALKEVNQQIARKKERLATIRGEEKKILAAIQQLNHKIVRQWNLLQEKKKARQEIEEKIRSISDSIGRLEERLKRQQKFVELRLRALWEFGPVGVLNVIFSSRSLDELYSRQQYLLSILQKDRALRETYMKNLAELRDKKHILDREKELLLKVEKEIEATAMRLEEAKETKRVFLDDLRAQEDNYKRLLLTLKSTEKGITTLIERLQSEASSGKGSVNPTAPLARGVGRGTPGGRGPSTPKIVENMGRLTPPILNAYRIITSEHDPRVPENGIVLESPMGSPVRTIFDGAVKYVGPVRGYGTVVIIDHGYGYMSLLGYLARAFVRPGQKVFEGETIGLAGPGGLVESGTYLEIRKDGRPVSALKFIDTKGMVIE